MQYDTLEEVPDFPVDASAHEDPPMNMPIGIAIKDVTKIFNRRVTILQLNSFIYLCINQRR